MISTKWLCLSEDREFVYAGNLRRVHLLTPSPILLDVSEAKLDGLTSPDRPDWIPEVVFYEDSFDAGAGIRRGRMYMRMELAPNDPAHEVQTLFAGAMQDHNQPSSSLLWYGSILPENIGSAFWGTEIKLGLPPRSSTWGVIEIEQTALDEVLLTLRKGGI